MPNSLVLVLFNSVTLAACAGPSTSEIQADFESPVANRVAEIHEETEGQGHGHVHVHESETTSGMEVVLVKSELVVGQNRFAVGLFDQAGHMVQDAAVHFHYYDLSHPADPILETEADAAPLHTPDGFTTIFAQEREFNRAGEWGVEVQARFADGTTALKRIGFEVIAGSPTLKPGQKAPALDTPSTATLPITTWPACGASGGSTIPCRMSSLRKMTCRTSRNCRTGWAGWNRP